MLLGKYTEIERENRILLEKMSNIMQDPKPKLYNPSNKSNNSFDFNLQNGLKWEV